jgi:hypothetical protein
MISDNSHIVIGYNEQKILNTGEVFENVYFSIHSS